MEEGINIGMTETILLWILQILKRWHVNISNDFMLINFGAQTKWTNSFKVANYRNSFEKKKITWLVQFLFNTLYFYFLPTKKILSSDGFSEELHPVVEVMEEIIKTLPEN